MLSSLFEEKRTFFVADRPTGGDGSGDDPWERDEELADIFKRTLSLAITRSMSTPNPFGIAQSVNNIVERTEQVGRCLILLAPTLRPIAKTLLSIKSPSDRLNPGVLESKFPNLDFQ